MDIEIRNTSDKGRGVFATKLIPKGCRHVSECIKFDFSEINVKSIFHMYAFGSFDASCGLIAVDWTSLINHSKEPNLKYRCNIYNQVEFEAIRDIEPDEELTIDYHYTISEQAKKHGINIEAWNASTITNNWC